VDPIRVSDIYVTAGFPEHTFVPPNAYARLVNSLGQRAGGVVVEGPSGIGKSVAVAHALGEIGGALAKRAKTLSSRDQLDITEIEHVASNHPPGLWIIEDFHHLPHATRERLADAIKHLADQRDAECKLVLVGINNAGQSLLVGSSDLLTRITVIEFERNPDESIERMIGLGEQWLNIRVPDHPRIVSEARGSFLLAQLICRSACDAAGLTEEHRAPTPLTLNIDLDQVIRSVLNDLALQFRDVCRKFARGKKPKRAGRAPYLQCLRWLAEANEWSVQLERAGDQNPRYKGSVIQILKKGFLAQHIHDDPEITKLIHLSAENYLSIEDPRFVFFLRHVNWDEYREQIGFGPESQHAYDFALSFAGAQRGVARAVHEALSECGFSVFFDEVERDRMLGTDLRAYLAPIYASSAEFVLVVLGPDYPRNYWTAFEQDQYNGRIADGSVIPVWTVTSAPTFASNLTARGGLTFASDDPTPQEIERAVEDLSSALDKRRWGQQRLDI